jgi:hypothetical protein
MSTTKLSAPGSRRTRTLQDDLLDDLRQAAPLPVARPSSSGHPGPAHGEELGSTAPDALTVELRLTPRCWSAPSVRTHPVGAGLVVTAGPLQLHLRGLGR